MIYCKHLGKVEYVLQEHANGSQHVRARCMNCNELFGRFIPKSGFSKSQLEAMPIAQSYVTSDNPCAVCGDTRTELQHFAPQELRDFFGGDWSNYPTCYLCVKHHLLWHKIVTPDLYAPKSVTALIRAWLDKIRYG